MDDARTNQALHDLARLYLTPAPGSTDDAPIPPEGSHMHKHGMTPSAAADRDPDDQPSSSPRIILVGHLPGFANLWINQYAQQLCETAGPVGVVHVHEEQIDLDLFQPGLPTPSGSSDKPDPTDLPQAIHDAAGSVRQWLVHLSDPQRDDLRALAGEIGRWTLLTGADEAAIVAAYRLLKQWVEPAGYTTGDPEIELAFLGCQPEAAEHAADRIQRTAGQFLDVAITVGQAQSKMQPVNRRRVGTFDPLESTSDLLDLLIVEEPFRLHLAADAADDPKHGMTPSSAADRDQPDPREMAGPPTPAPTPERRASVAPDSWEAPAPDPVESPQSPATLAAYVEGLESIAARSPRNESVELALDEAGRLHLLLDPGDAPDALATLMTVQSWAIEHADLLAMTVPDRDYDKQATPTLHLFTTQPKRFAPHAGMLKLHLLLPVTVGNATTLTHVEIN